MQQAVIKANLNLDYAGSEAFNTVCSNLTFSGKNIKKIVITSCEPNIFEEAKLPDKPVSPSKVRDIVIGFILGALIAMVIIAIKFFSDDRIFTSEDINKVGNIATLGLVPLQDFEHNEEKGAPSSAYGPRDDEKDRKGGRE